jgi:DNA-binding NtrC family response regulator
LGTNILIVDDDASIRFGFSRYLEHAGYQVHDVSRLAEAKAAILDARYDVVLLDLSMPDGNGLELVPELRESYPDLVIVVISGVGGIPDAVEAMRRGADSFLAKPIVMADLEVLLRKYLDMARLRRKQMMIDRAADAGGVDELYVGKSPVMKEVMDLAQIAAASESAVLVQGETGTGKGLLARWIHDHGARRSGPLVEVNCSGLRGDLLANELFGHARGAFTSAAQDRMGLIDMAHGGTLFLDEIGDMDEGVQAQFLKVIEEKRYRRLGDVRVRSSDFRLVCATNRDLPEDVRKGRFRSELYYRIHVLPMRLPPLRSRREDIHGLSRQILETMGLGGIEILPETSTLLEEYPWPGNTRELKNVLERAALLAGNHPLAPGHFPGVLAPGAAAAGGGDVMSLDAVEQAHIRRVMAAFGGDTKEASRALGVSRATLYRLLKKMGRKS